MSRGPDPSVTTSGTSPWAIRRSPWFLLLDLPFVGAGPVITIPRHDLSLGPAVLVVLLALAIGGLQARHSLAAVRGERPAGVVWTFLALAALVYVPMWWFTWDWAVMQWFVVASAAMLIPHRALALAVAAGPIVGQTAVAAWYSIAEPGVGPGLEAVVTIYHFTLLVMGSAVIYGSVWLGQVLLDLDAARTEMAELAVGRERLRMSRDVHDLLGQSLSAVSLKGDLALRLLPTDPVAARAEIESLTGVARDALRDVRAVVRDEHVVSLAAELDAAATLLGAAGIDARIDADRPGLPWAVEEVLAWAVREATTNLVRHSDATACSIVATHQDGAVRLEVVNDGLRDSSPATAAGTGSGRAVASTATGRGGRSGAADGTGQIEPGRSSGGTGLAGLSERARALSGSASAGRTPDGRFRLVVDLPVVAGVSGAAPAVTADAGARHETGSGT